MGCHDIVVSLRKRDNYSSARDVRLPSCVCIIVSVRRPELFLLIYRGAGSCSSSRANCWCTGLLYPSDAKARQPPGSAYGSVYPLQATSFNYTEDCCVGRAPL